MNKRNNDQEHLRGYVLLVKAMLINVFDRIRIKDSWHHKKISPRMLAKKEVELEELGKWLHTQACRTWFHMLGACIGMSSKKMLDTYIRTHTDSVEFIRKYKKNRHVDKPPIDKPKRRSIIEVK